MLERNSWKRSDHASTHWLCIHLMMWWDHWGGLGRPAHLARTTSAVLRHCAVELGGVFQSLFQSLFDSYIVPQLWKHSKVILIPRKSTTKVLSDFRCVALTSLVMKAMERIVKQHSIRVINSQIDPFHQCHCMSRGIDDAKIFILDTLKQPNLYRPFQQLDCLLISPLHSIPSSLTSWLTNSPPTFSWMISSSCD